MKIAVRGGHTPASTGAVALLNELTEDRKVKTAVIKYLQNLGHTVKDVTPGDAVSYPAELNAGINSANNWGADLFVSIHFNKAYNSYNGTIGSEVCVYRSCDEAKRVVNKLASLGFENRGQKVRTDLGELKRTNMKSMIIEVCFVEATEDVKLYKKLGADVIGKAIAEGIANKNINSKPEVTQPKPPTTQKQLWENSIQGEEVKSLQRVINVKCDGYFGNDTLKACPILRQSGAYSSVALQMQKRLNKLGYNFKADGYFGPTTLKYVKEFQKARKITADGIVGKNTWTELYKK